MALFTFFCRDGENGAALRDKLRAQHLAHMEASLDKIAVAGPLKDGEKIVGSLLVLKADDEAEARALLESDPYFAAGVWQSIKVDGFLAVTGDWVGGATWK